MEKLLLLSLYKLSKNLPFLCALKRHNGFNANNKIEYYCVQTTILNFMIWECTHKVPSLIPSVTNVIEQPSLKKYDTFGRRFIMSFTFLCYKY